MKKSIRTLFYAVFCTSLLTATITQPVNYNDAKTALKYASAAYLGVWAAALGGKAINVVFALEESDQENRYREKTIKIRAISLVNNVTNLPLNCLKKFHAVADPLRFVGAAALGCLSYGCYRIAHNIVQ